MAKRIPHKAGDIWKRGDHTMRVERVEEHGGETILVMACNEGFGRPGFFMDCGARRVHFAALAEEA